VRERRPYGIRWAWQLARYVVGLGALAAASWAISGKTDELRGAAEYLDRLRPLWLVPALAGEAASYLALSSLQRRLLTAGRVRAGSLSLTGVTLAATAIQNSLPAGPLFAYAYDFRQYRRYGADDVLAGWTLAAFNTVCFLTLVAMAAFGLAMAFSAGTAYDLVDAILGIVIVAGLLVTTWIERGLLMHPAAVMVALALRIKGKPDPRGQAERMVTSVMARLSSVSPTAREWAAAVAVGLASWIGDLSCLVLSFIAVGAGVPWRGLLLAYGAGQLAAALPVTPGGLGVVEGSLTLALVTFGGQQDSTVAAVLLYRLMSFWLLLPVGWGSWLAVTLAGRKPRPVAVAGSNG